MASEGTDFLHGCADIARFMGISQRRAYHLLENRLIPAAKLGSKWTARKSRLIAHLENAENANLGSTDGAA